MFCIPKQLVERIKQSALNGEIDMQKLYDMTSEERRNFFTQRVGPETSKLINTELEKAMVSKQKNALKSWAESVFTPESKNKPVYKNILDKINNLDELGVLNPKTEKAFLEDLVSDKLGVNVSPEEVKIISEKAKRIQDVQSKLGDDIGNISEKFDENMEFFKAKKEMDDYLKSLSPTSQLRVLTGTIGRGMMLASLKSPILNIGSNIEIGLTEAISRRLASGGLKGTDNALAIDYVKKINKIYQQTGYDLSRAENINDLGVSGERVLGETVHSGGKGIIRKTGRIIEDTVFKQLMGAPDVAFSSAHFADSVNINALKLSKGDITKAKEFMVDSMKLKPQTSEGEMLRTQGIMDAQMATWTNSSWASKLSEGIRKLINQATGDARLGDYLLPFVKTPANVISTGMDYAGLGVPKAIVEVVNGIRAKDLGSKERVSKISRDLVRSGLGLTASVIIAYQLKDDDFVGAYDPNRSQIEGLRGSPAENSIRIGDKWISTDWFGPLSIPLSSIMYARKYGKAGKGEMAFQYGKGVVSQIGQLPGISDLYDEVKTYAYKKDQTLQEMTGEAENYLTSQLYSRLVPSFLSDFAKATDKYERQSVKGVEGLKSKVPGLRETLPIKTNVFGEQVETQPAWSTLLFGSRVKTSTENETIKEINKISESNGKGINFTDWDKSSSKTLIQFKEKVGQEKFDKAKTQYGEELKKELESLFKNPLYNKLTDEEKYNTIIGKDTDAMNKIFKLYGFKYKQENKTKINL